MTALTTTPDQILAVGLVHLITPGPQTGWPHRIQEDLDRRDAAHRDVMAASYGSDDWHDAYWRRRGAETRIATVLGLPQRPGYH